MHALLHVLAGDLRGAHVLAAQSCWLAADAGLTVAELEQVTKYYSTPIANK
jgi:hypothetical protein